MMDKFPRSFNNYHVGLYIPIDFKRECLICRVIYLTELDVIRSYFEEVYRMESSLNMHASPTKLYELAHDSQFYNKGMSQYQRNGHCVRDL